MTDIAKLIENTIRADVRAVGSYHVPDSIGYVKLDSMENPYQLPDDLRAELGTRLAEAALNRYPVPSYSTLKASICARLGVPSGYDVLLGNGSDELITILATAIARQERAPGSKRAVVMAPIPAFVMFSRSAQFAGADFVGVPIKPDFSLDMAAMLAAIEEHKPSLLFLAYPNNPTGNLYDADDMVAIIEALGEHGIVVVDEAYQPFAKVSFMERLPQHPNLVVMRTLSKLGLAGIRLGYMAAAAPLLAEFEKVRPPYNVNVLTQVAAEFALDHIDVLDRQAGLLNEERTRLAAALAALPGVEVFPSAANFISLRVPDAERACANLHGEKVLIKNLSKMHTLLANCIRVTVSIPEENEQFLTALKKTL